MRRSFARLAAACAFAMTAFTGSALAGNAHRNDNAPPVTPPAPPIVQVTPATAAPVAKSAGDVLGAQIGSLPRPALPGVLDGPTLPFTGFPTWLAAIVGFTLILAGLALRRHGSSRAG